MRIHQQLHVEHVGQQHTGRILGLAGKSRYRNLCQRRHRLADDVQVLRSIALPLFRCDLLITFDNGVALAMPAAGRVIAHHRQLDLNDGFHFGFDLNLGLLGILAHIRLLGRVRFYQTAWRRRFPKENLARVRVMEVSYLLKNICFLSGCVSTR